MDHEEIIKSLTIKRKILGITQRELAELTEITQPAIARMERMRVEATVSTICKVADALGMVLVLKEKKDE